jgi:hypothetical protein
MQIDERALNFIQKAKAAGFSQQEVYEELLAKGYEIGAPRVEQTTEPEKSPYSGVEKAKYFTRAGLNGITLNFMPLGAGVTNAVVTPLAEAYTSISDRRKPIASNLNPWTNFKQGYRDFVNEQKDFGKVHPVLNFTGELVGGLGTGIVGAGKKLATTAAQKGIKALMAEGAREAGKFGFFGGFGSGLTKDPNKISATDALKEGGVGLAGGAVMGAALPPAIAVGAKALSPVVKGGKAVAKKIATILKNDAQQANQALGNAGYVATDMAPENKVFFNLLEANPEGTMEAVNKGEPLIAHANRQQLRRTRGAVTSDEKADEAFIEAKRAFDQGKIQKGEDISDRLLSKESGYTATERIADEAHSKYQPLYEEVMKMGEIDLPQEIIANETILGAIQEAQGRAGYTKLKANNVRVLDKAKRVLQDKYKSLKRAGKNDEAREYQLAKEELVAFMDSKLPQYAEARKAFMEGQELQEFVELGRKLKNISHAEVERIAKTLTPEEQQALKAGIGDSVRESLYNTRNEGSNVLEKAFPAPLRRKLEVLGIKDEEIAKEIGKELQTNANYQFVGGGSNTMNKAEDVAKLGFGPLVRTIKAIRNPLGTLEKAADKLDNKIAGLDSEEIARLMFNAEALAKEAKKPEHQRRIAEILRKSKQSEGGQSISGYLGRKLKEKGGYAMKPLDKTVNSLGEPVAKTKEGIKNFNKWFKDAAKEAKDSKENPRVFHHKTYADNIEVFKMGKGTNAGGKGIYFSERPEGRYGNIDYPVYLNFKNPKIVDGLKSGQSLSARKAGHDAIVDKRTGYVIVFDPNQIKSVKNSGKFDPKNPNIYKSIVGGLGISQILKSKENK